MIKGDIPCSPSSATMCQVAKKYTFKDAKQGFAEDHLNSYEAAALAEPFNNLLRAHLPQYPTVKFLQCVRLLELKSEWSACAQSFAGDAGERDEHTCIAHRSRTSPAISSLGGQHDGKVGRKFWEGGRGEV